MILVGDRYISLMVLFSVALHLLWAVLIFHDHSAVNATAVHGVGKFIESPILLAMTFAGVAWCATLGIFTRLPWIVLLLIPQQIVLLFSAVGVVEAIWLAQFADGVVRSRSFLAADQIYTVLAAVGHTFAMIAHAKRIVR